MIENFNDFNLSKEVLKAVVEMGFEEPSPIQKQAIPTMLNNEDIIGQAQTGTGKTASFGIPIVEKVNKDSKTTQAMVLCPIAVLALAIDGKVNRYIVAASFLLIVVVLALTFGLIFMFSSKRRMRVTAAGVSRFINMLVKFVTLGKKRRVMKSKSVEGFFAVDRKSVV